MRRSYAIVCSVILIFAGSVKAQSQLLTIESCYERAKNNYPLIKQYGLIEKTKEYTISNANKAYLPQLSITAIEGYVFGDFPSLGGSDDSKFKFIGIGQVNQAIWDGGATKTQKEIAKASAEADKASIDVSMHDLRSRVNDLYFGILLINEQLKQLDVQKAILEHNVDRAKKLLDNGLAYKTDVDEIKVEQLNIDKQKRDFLYTRSGYQVMLSYLIGAPVNDTTELEVPSAKLLNENAAINRPELQQYAKQRDLVNAQSDMQKVGLMPKVGLLGAGVLLAPGVNLGATKMSNIGVVGLSASWDIKALYKNSNEKGLTRQQLEKLDVQQETFEFNTKLQMQQKISDIHRKEAIIKDDQEVVKLRQTIREGYQLKYDTGVGPLIDLLDAAQKEGAARADKALHEIQLLSAQYQYLTITGN